MWFNILMFTFGKNEIGPSRLGSRRRDEKFFSAISTFTFSGQKEMNRWEYVSRNKFH
jgi:hypothetical protein